MIELHQLDEKYNKETEKKKEKELRTYRFLLFFTCVLYPVFGYFNTYVIQPQVEKPAILLQRILFSVLIIIFISLSFFVKAVKEKFYIVIVGFIYIGLSHLMYIGANIGFSFSQTLGTLMVIMGTSMVFRSFNHLKFYLGYVIVSVIFCSLIAPKNDLATPVVILIFCGIVMALYFSLNMKFKVQQIIQENHANINALIENTEDLVWSIDTNYKYIAFNSSFETNFFMLTGEKPIIGEKVILDELKEKTSGELMIQYKEVMLGNSQTVEYNFVLNRKIIYYIFSFNPIRLANNKIIGITVFGHNITAIRDRELEIQKQNLKITESINYAKQIQDSILPKELVLKEVFQDSFIIYIPKQIVSGDFPFFFQKGNDIYVAAVDCTGHGVPGALLSVIGALLLNEVVRYETLTASELCDKLHDHVLRTLKQGQIGCENETDGMDVAMCKINISTGELEYAGAHRPLFILRKDFKSGDEIEELKGDKFPIGGVQYRNRTLFNKHDTVLEKGDRLFFFSDGLTDQFGGFEERPRKIGLNNIKELLTTNHEKSVIEMRTVTTDYFHNWRGEEKQIDDVLMIGLKF